MSELDFWRDEHDCSSSYEEIPEEWKDDSDIGCNDCPADECTGHCMSCSYRSV